MLLKVRQLVVENLGYKRSITHKNIYIKIDNIVSISDYNGAEDFLLSEGSEYSSDKFSLIKVNEGQQVEYVIAFGDAEEIYSEIRGDLSGKRILND